MKRIVAYHFRSALTLPEIRARFEEVGPWRWIERDNDRLGEYFSTSVLPGPGRNIIKLFIEDDVFAINLFLESGPAEIESVCATVFEELLPCVGATDLAETDHFE